MDRVHQPPRRLEAQGLLRQRRRRLRQRRHEAFWATLKKEVHHIWGPIETFTRTELRTILFDYIEVFYNRSRHQGSLGDRTPAETYAARRAA